MNSAFLFVLLVIILFVLIIINNLYQKKSTYVLLSISIIIGIVLYSYGYFYISDKNISSIGISALKSIFAIFGMISGKNSLSDINSVPLYNNQIIILLFYVIHLFIYTMVITTLLVNFGKRLILSLDNFARLFFCKKNIYIFYKLNDRTRSVINKIKSDDNQIVILDDNFLDNKSNDFYNFVIKKFSVVLDSTIFSTKNDKKVISNKYLSKIFKDKKYKNHNIRLYLLGSDIDDNYTFACNLHECLINSESFNTIKLTIFIDEKYDLKYLSENKIFEYVRCFDEKEIMSRVLVRNYPPSKYIEFDNFKAKDNQSFDSLIIGFGALSQKILKKLYVYGHFVNTVFNATIIDKNYKDISGCFNHEFDFLNDERLYINKTTNINHLDCDARSDEFYKYFIENKNIINYIVVATGDEKTNEDIIKNLIRLRLDLNLSFDLFDCLDNRIYAYEHNEAKNIKIEYNNIDYLVDDRIDTAGKWINYIYNNTKKVERDEVFDPVALKDKIDELWNESNSFDKNSSISAADFYTSILKASGIKNTDFKNPKFTKEELDKIENDFNKDFDTNYYRITGIEHDRWSAYQLAESGYRYMDDEHWDKRAKNYEEQHNKNKFYKIQNDRENKLHAYLRSMEDLKKLYVKEKAATGNDPTTRWGVNSFDLAIRVARNINKI